ncbi:MAG TPA: TolC family protein, partial [Spirochaetales bacterium]|nr:TolC family protein [Spirochaetales bacterium]
LDLALVAALEKANEAGKRLAAGSGLFRPDFAFRAELGYSGPRLPFVEEGWEDKDDWSLNLSVATSLELFDGGEARAARGKAAAELEKARARSEEARSGIANLLRSGFLDLELARVRLEYDILKLEGHGEKVKGLRAERDAGSGSEAAYLRALLDTLGTVADGWARLAEYRGALWKLEAALP